MYEENTCLVAVKSIKECKMSKFEKKFGKYAREFDSSTLEKLVAGIDLPAFFVSNFLFYLVVISGNSQICMIY